MRLRVDISAAGGGGGGGRLSLPELLGLPALRVGVPVPWSGGGGAGGGWEGLRCGVPDLLLGVEPSGDPGSAMY